MGIKKDSRLALNERDKFEPEITLNPENGIIIKQRARRGIIIIIV